MGRLKKIAHVGILTCLVVLMVSIFMLPTDAANITYNLSDMTSSNTAKTVTDGTAYSTTLTVSTDYKLPASIVITTGETVLGASDYTYSPTTGKLTIQASSVYGEITIFGQAVALKTVSIPTIDGNFVIYETLSAVVTPAEATVDYQWYRGKTAISGATSPTYTLTMADIGKEINVQVTGTGDYTGQKISTSNTTVSKKSTVSPAQDDVTITHVTKNGGTNGVIAANSTLSLEYYDTVSTTWKSLPARSKAAGAYQIRFAETSDTLPSESTMVRIYEPCTSPVDTDITITHLTTAGASTGKMVSNSSKILEFYNGTSWVTFPVAGLKAGKYQVRFAATTEYLASEGVYFYVMEPTTLVMSSLDVAVTHVAVNGGSTGELKSAASNAATMEALVAGVWKTLPLKQLKAGTYQVRYAATETTFASATCNVIIKEPATPPSGIKTTDVSVYGGNTGAIAGLSTAWQVSYDGTTWHDCTQTSMTGLSAGTYYFRTKATDYYLASETVECTIKQPEITPEATIDYVNGTLKNLVAKADYIIDNVVYTATSDGTISIVDNSLDGRSIGLIKKGNGTTTNNSAKQMINIPTRPSVPDAPLIMSRKDTEVTVALTNGVEYSIDGKTWMTATGTSYTFTGLKANTAYTVHARVKAVEGSSFCSVSVGTSVTTKKSSSSAVTPKKPTTSQITDTSITVQVVNGQEYKLGDYAWVTPAGSTYTWNNLKEATNYTITTRTAETEDTMYSSSLSSTVKTYTKLTVGTFSVDYWKQAITGLATGQYSINGGEAVTVGSDGQLDVEDYFGRTVKLRRVGSEATKTVDSDPVDVAIISPVAAPTKAEFDASTVQSTLNSLIIPNPRADLEYQVLDTDGFPVSAWKSSTGDSIVFDGLEHSTPYLIQLSFCQTESQPKSNAYISDAVYTKFYEDTPAAVVNTLTQRLNELIPNAAYLVNGISYNADANGTVAILDIWVDSAITVVKCGDGIKTVDSMAQTLDLPGRTTLVLDAVVGQVTYYGGNNGSISGVSTNMEYSADGGVTWNEVTGDTLSGLYAMDYLVRRKGVADRLFASVPQTVTVTVATEIADYKQEVIGELEQAYENMASSKRYSDAQLAQLRAILDAGIQNINTSFTQPDDIDNAKNTILGNMAQVPCANTPTADGKLVGTDLVSNEMLQYPNDSDEVWGNVSNTEGLDASLIFVIEKLGQSATEELRALINQAIVRGEIASFDGSMSAEELQTALNNADLKVGLNITLKQGATPTENFKGTYTVTMLLPADVQGMDHLSVISVDADGNLAYHLATVTGNYLAFDTDHFSIYGIVGLDTLALAKAETLQNISDLYDSLNSKKYSRDNWNDLQQAFLTAIDKVTNAETEEEVSDAWNELSDTVNNTKTKKSLGWLWILILILIVLIAIVIVCFLVWHVRYFDGDECICSEFHFWKSKVALLARNKDGFVLDGWYHDPELTDRAENGFPMPWHGVKLYAKWNAIEILSTVEEEPVIEPMPEETEESEESEPVESKSEVIMLEESVEETTEEMAEETVEETAEEPVNEEPKDEIAMLAEPTAETEETAEEIPEETEDLTAPEEIHEAEPETVEEAEPMLEEESLDAEEDRPAVVVVGETVEDDGDTDAEGEEEPAEDEDSYKNSDSYQAWLQFGEGGDDADADEITRLEDGDEVQLFTNEKTGEKYHIRFNLSFRAKMTSLSDEAKGFYRELKDEFLTYKKVKTRISWKSEAVRKGRETIAKFAVRENTLCVFLALDPDQYKDSKYVFESVKEIKAYEGVPMLVRVKSDLSCRKVKELIADIMQPREVKRLEAAPETDYSYLDEDSSTEARLRAGQLRIWAEGPDAQVCAARAAAATLHYLISPEATAEEAESLISDEMLDALMPPATEILIVPDLIQEVSIEQLCKKFYEGDIIDVASLKEKGLMEPDMTYVKITSAGEMTKKLTVSAHMFERTAAKMILLTGGDATIITE